jgi:hypothetical protein
MARIWLGALERSLSLCDLEWDLFGEARPEMVVSAHTEGVEAQRLLPLAGDSDHDRGPYNLIGFAAAGSSVGMEQHF